MKVGSVFDLPLHPSPLDSGDHATLRIDVLQVVARLLFDGGGQRFEVVGASERIHRLGDTRFQGKNLLDTQCHAGRSSLGRLSASS